MSGLNDEKLIEEIIGENIENINQQDNFCT